MLDRQLLLSQTRRAFTIAGKDIRIYYLKGPVVIFGILFPAFLYFSFVVGRNMDAEVMLPGLLGMVLFFTSTSISPAVAPMETAAKTLERLMACPVTPQTIILGDILIFAIGTKFGNRILQKGWFKRQISESQIQSLKSRLEKRSILMIFLARHLFYLRTATFLICGADMSAFQLVDGDTSAPSNEPSDLLSGNRLAAVGKPDQHVADTLNLNAGRGFPAFHPSHDLPHETGRSVVFNTKLGF